MNVACLSLLMYMSVHMGISGTRNQIYQILFACYLWPWLSLTSYGGICYELPDVDDLCHVSVAYSDQE